MEHIRTLELRGVSREYNGVPALREFNLRLTGGSFTTLLGPSGCGKSTVLNCLAGLIPLTTGDILLNDQPIQHVPAERRGFGMVFQNYALFPHLTVARNVSYGLDVRGVPRAERARRVQWALGLVHLQDFGARYPAQLSGGQQQRLAIARTIALQPSLLLLDEPLSNLDTNLRNEMRIEIKRLHNELGLTTVYVTHDQSEALSLSDVVVVMRQGQIEQVGSPQELYTWPVSLYAANFMGYVNRLQATLLGKDGAYWAVETQTGARLLASAGPAAGAGWRAGQALTLAFRPDDTLIDPMPAANQLQGAVRLVEYMGAAFEALIHVDASATGVQPPQLLARSAQAPVVGAAVTFGVAPDRLLAFTADAADGAGSGAAMSAAPATSAPVESAFVAPTPSDLQEVR